MPKTFADYMVELMGTRGVDKGNGEPFSNHKKGVRNITLYTGQQPATAEEWVRQNKAIFDG